MPSIETELNVTVGRVEGAKAVLITDDMDVLEVPSSIIPSLPAGNKTLKMTLKATETSASRIGLIVDKLRSGPAKTGESLKAIEREGFLFVRSRSHYGITVAWTPFAEIESSEWAALHGVDPIVNGTKMTQGSKIDDKEGELKMTGLQPASEYDIQLAFRTSFGTFRTTTVHVATPMLSDFSGLSIAVDTVLESSEQERLLSLIKDMGANVSAEITERTTQLVSDSPESAMAKEASTLNVPVVTAKWLDACRSESKLVSVSSFYSAK